MYVVGIQRQSNSIVPYGFNERTAASAEHEDVAGERITAETFLHEQRQTLHALAHIGVAGGDPDSHACSDRDHRRSRTCSTRDSAAASTPASTITRRSLPTIITIRPFTGAAATTGSAPAATITGAKPTRCTSGGVGSGQSLGLHIARLCLSFLLARASVRLPGCLPFRRSMKSFRASALAAGFKTMPAVRPSRNRPSRMFFTGGKSG